MDASTTGKTVYLHVGAPTAAAAYLQRVLWTNRHRLAGAGVGYPITRPLEHFAGVMDLRRDMTWGGGRDPAWDGTWGRIAGRARDWHGPVVVISQELLGGATEDQARQAVESFGPADVHVVFATRDLAWQLVYDWQEQIKHTHTVSFEDFVGDLVRLGIDAPAPFGPMFWGLHDPARALRSWSAVLPADRIHVLTVPPPGGDPGLLWRRFGGLIGIDPGVCDLSGLDDEPPLGVLEAALLRRLNERLPAILGGSYEAVVRDHVLPVLREVHPDSTPMRLPDEHYDWAERKSRELVDGIRRAGYRVVGDLAELAPDRDRSHADLPGEVSDEELVELSVAVITGLLNRLAVAHDQVGLAHLHAEMSQVRENMARLLDMASTASAPTLLRAVKRGSGRLQ